MLITKGAVQSREERKKLRQTEGQNHTTQSELNKEKNVRRKETKEAQQTDRKEGISRPG